MYEEAEPIYRRAVAIAETTVGTEHPQYSSMLNGLAGLLLHQVRADLRTSLLAR